MNANSNGSANGNTQLLRQVEESYIRIGCPEKVMCALSGGADSVALLLILNELRKKYPLSLYAVHIHHGLRKASDSEETFVRSLCESLPVPLEVVRIHVPENGNTESLARNGRYEAIYETAENINCRVIVLAHHASDQAELLLMRLVRGCGDGLHCMREISEAENGMLLWRPLISVMPDNLRTYNNEHHAAWCEDESNHDTAYVRNYMRHCVLPLLEKKCPGAVANMARSAGLISRNIDYITSESGKILQMAAEKAVIPALNCDMLKKYHPALIAETVRLWLKPYIKDIPYAVPDRLMALSHGQKCPVSQGISAERYGDRIYLTGSVFSVGPGRTEVTPYEGETGDGKTRQAMPESVYRNAVLRYRKTGDVICPWGLHGSKSLSDYMTDRKIPRPLRDYIPLMCIGNQVVWVIGYGIARMAAVRENEPCVMLHYYPPEEKD